MLSSNICSSQMILTIFFLTEESADSQSDQTSTGIAQENEQNKSTSVNPLQTPTEVQPVPIMGKRLNNKY